MRRRSSFPSPPPVQSKQNSDGESNSSDWWSKRRIRRTCPTDINIQIDIANWSWEYAFGPSLFEDDPDSHSESRTLEIRGTSADAVPPIKKGMELTLRVFGEEHYQRGNRHKLKIDKVGLLYKERSSVEGSLVMPGDALPLVLMMLSAGKYSQILLFASKFEKRASVVRYYHFS